MRERGILFSAPMVRALLRDIDPKTQTRRVLKQATGPSLSVGYEDGAAELSWLHGDGPGHEVNETIKRVPCPYGVPGDRLWVRETWQYSDWTEDGEPWIGYAACGEPILCRTFDEAWNERLGYIWASLSDPKNYDIDNRAADRCWRPSIHMPRWASRITLEITAVRVERLQSISEADAIAEGAMPILVPPDGGSCPHVEGYAALWGSINGDGSWEANPWVWCIEFKRVTP